MHVYLHAIMRSKIVVKIMSKFTAGRKLLPHIPKHIVREILSHIFK